MNRVQRLEHERNSGTERQGQASCQQYEINEVTESVEFDQNIVRKFFKSNARDTGLPDMNKAHHLLKPVIRHRTLSVLELRPAAPSKPVKLQRSPDSGTSFLQSKY